MDMHTARLCVGGCVGVFIYVSFSCRAAPSLLCVLLPRVRLARYGLCSAVRALGFQDQSQAAEFFRHYGLTVDGEGDGQVILDPVAWTSHREKEQGSSNAAADMWSASSEDEPRMEEIEPPFQPVAR